MKNRIKFAMTFVACANIGIAAHESLMATVLTTAGICTYLLRPLFLRWFS